jgi:hypothetical protein
MFLETRVEVPALGKEQVVSSGLLITWLLAGVSMDGKGGRLAGWIQICSNKLRSIQ